MTSQDTEFWTPARRVTVGNAITWFAVGGIAIIFLLLALGFLDV